jgi:DNA-binding response OmpR family regulator
MAWSHSIDRHAMPQLPIVDLVPALVVEDMPAARDGLVRALCDLCGADADIATAGSLAGALIALRDRPRVFVLVDIGLPHGNGVELIEWLHAHRPDAVSMVVSAWGDEETVLAALRAGATGYLFKERDASELHAALHTYDSTTHVSFSTLGARGEVNFAHNLNLHGELGWQHAFGDTTPEANLQFVAGGPAFTEYGVPVAKNAGLGRIGVGWHQGNVALDADYEGLAGNGVKDQAAKVSVSITF